MSQKKSKIFAKVTFSLLPLAICLLAIVYFTCNFSSGKIDVGLAGIVTEALSVQLSMWWPILIASIVGSAMFFCILKFKNKTFILISWVFAVLIAIFVGLVLLLQCFFLLFLTFNSNPIVIDFFIFSPMLIFLAFVIVFLFFIKDSIKIYKKTV